MERGGRGEEVGQRTPVRRPAPSDAERRKQGEWETQKGGEACTTADARQRDTLHSQIGWERKREREREQKCREKGEERVGRRRKRVTSVHETRKDNS